MIELPTPIDLGNECEMDEDKKDYHAMLYYDILIKLPPELLTELEESILIHAIVKHARITEKDAIEKTDEMLRRVSEEFDVGIPILKGKTRFTAETFGRKAFWWLLKNQVIPNSFSLKMLGAFVNREHVTVLFNLKKLEDLLHAEVSLRESIMYLANSYGWRTEWTGEKIRLY